MDRRGELRRMYRERKVIGCVYRIRNTVTGRFLLMYSDDAQAAGNIYDFALRTSTPFPHSASPRLREDWKEYGAAAFEFEVLERLEKKAEQSDREFLGDLKALREMWSEQLGETDNRY